MPLLVTKVANGDMEETTLITKLMMDQLHCSQKTSAIQLTSPKLLQSQFGKCVSLQLLQLFAPTLLVATGLMEKNSFQTTSSALQWISPQTLISLRHVSLLRMLLNVMMDANGDKEEMLVDSTVDQTHCSQLSSAIQLTLMEPQHLPSGNLVLTPLMLLTAPLLKAASGLMVKN
jgi:hypothetical protein